MRAAAGGSVRVAPVVSPRNLQIGSRYLLLGVLAATAAVLVWRVNIPAAVLIAWIGMCLFLVSANYALGTNDFLHKRRRGYSPAVWILYGPYLLGCLVNWHYWRARLQPMSEIVPGLWIGARPGRADWAKVQRRNIGAVIDLVPELSATPPAGIAHSHLPFLDLVVPDPARLDQAAKLIEETLGSRNVLVHCALGMSRSVLAVCAWLIRNGHSAEGALNLVGRVRAERVSRPYMRISLDLYEAFLRRRDAGAAAGPAADGP